MSQYAEYQRNKNVLSSHLNSLRRMSNNMAMIDGHRSSVVSSSPSFNALAVTEMKSSEFNTIDKTTMTAQSGGKRLKKSSADTWTKC